MMCEGMELEDFFYQGKDDYLFKDDKFFEQMDQDLDFAFALSLQTQYDEEVQVITQSPSCSKESKDKSKPLSIVDKQWELIDPHPDIRCLFLEYNTKFFYGKLVGVEVKWSPRMTLCAGVCCYEGRGGLCSIKLSVPLLKLRPRRDLVETLLHEMIHAYLFVTHNNKDREGHGPEFLKHMSRINKETGTRITVYHSFHDEVDLYRTHWWKCDGPCQKRKPFYGLVKRSMNRTPGPSDNWWKQHQATCGGSFKKVREPENNKKKKVDSKKNLNESGGSDIRSFLGNGPEKFINAKEMKIDAAKHVFSKENNVIGMNSKNSISHVSPTKHIPFSGQGFVLGTSSSSKSKSVLLERFSNVPKVGTHQIDSLKRKQPNYNTEGSKKAVTDTAGSSKNSKLPLPRSPINLTSSTNPSTKYVQSPIRRFFEVSSPKNIQGNAYLLKNEDSQKNLQSKSNLINCPVCLNQVKIDQINSHLDECLKNNSS